jgi:hypothetical protein
VHQPFSTLSLSFFLTLDENFSGIYEYVKSEVKILMPEIGPASRGAKITIFLI